MIELQAIRSNQRVTLETMFQLYLHDMSEVLGWELTEEGRFSFSENLLTPYWSDANHWPYFILFRNNLIGFALVRRLKDGGQPEGGACFDMGQFFVLRAYRKAGPHPSIARDAFQLCLQKHPGMWQVRVFPENLTGIRFWRKAINGFGEDVVGKIYETTDAYEGKNMTYIRFNT